MLRDRCAPVELIIEIGIREPSVERVVLPDGILGLLGNVGCVVRSSGLRHGHLGGLVPVYKGDDGIAHDVRDVLMRGRAVLVECSDGDRVVSGLRERVDRVLPVASVGSQQRVVCTHHFRIVGNRIPGVKDRSVAEIPANVVYIVGGIQMEGGAVCPCFPEVFRLGFLGIHTGNEKKNAAGDGHRRQQHRQQFL